MNHVFADTSYYIALMGEHDQHHAAAVAHAQTFYGEIITTDFVLVEVGNWFAKWAKAVGVEYGKLAAAEKDDMIAELDAVVAHLYGLSESQLTHIFETFHEGWDYQPRLEAVLAHYRTWSAGVPPA
jgi:predicted nucleic acid-binding protein